VSDLNMVILEGRVRGEVENRRTAKGLSITTFKIEHQGGYLDRNGEWRVNNPQVIEVTLFGERGEGAISQFADGDAILIEGKVSSNEFKEKYYTKIIANSVMPRGAVTRRANPAPNRQTVEPIRKAETPNPETPDVPNTGTKLEEDDLPF
jgi:single-stranded DNA-binding protein